MVVVGVLQELWGTAVAGSGWRYALRRIAEDVAEVAGFALCVEDIVLGEKPVLQVVRHLFALLLQSGDGRFQCVERLPQIAYGFVVALLDAAQFGFLKLAFAFHGGVLVGRWRYGPASPAVALRLGILHQLPVCLGFGVGTLPCISKVGAQGAQFGGFLHLAYPGVDGGNLALVGLEISVRLLTVEY